MDDESMDDEFVQATEVEERLLKAHNEEDDVRCFLLGSNFVATIDADGSGSSAGTGTPSTVEMVTRSTRSTIDGSTSVSIPVKR